MEAVLSASSVSARMPSRMERRQSVQTYRSQDEYLLAMKEDLAEWFNQLYDINIRVDTFFEDLETGVLLCRHAKNANDFINASAAAAAAAAAGKEANEECPVSPNFPVGTIPVVSSPICADKILQDHPSAPDQRISYRADVKPGTFQSRDNISNFIAWCRRVLKIPDTLIFESDDLVMRKNERSVVLCLLESARRCARYGMPMPLLIQLEQEIDAEIAADAAAELSGSKEGQREVTIESKVVETNNKRRGPAIVVDMKSLDELVREILSRCTCPDMFPMIRVSEGKYRIGDSLTMIFVRVLRNHVMVRIGGGWDTLENYLDRHDPCRCHSKGHRQLPSTPQTMRHLTPVIGDKSARQTITEINDASSDVDQSPTKSIRTGSSSSDSQERLNDNVASDNRKQSASVNRQQVQRRRSRTPLILFNTPESDSRVPVDRENETDKTENKRFQSPSKIPNGPSTTAGIADATSKRRNSLQPNTLTSTGHEDRRRERGRTTGRRSVDPTQRRRLPRAGSVGSGYENDNRDDRFSDRPVSANRDPQVLMIARNAGGKHKVDNTKADERTALVEERRQMSASRPSRQQKDSNQQQLQQQHIQQQQQPSKHLMQISSNRLLPSKPKFPLRKSGSLSSEDSFDCNTFNRKSSPAKPAVQDGNTTSSGDDLECSTVEITDQELAKLLEGIANLVKHDIPDSLGSVDAKNAEKNNADVKLRHSHVTESVYQNTDIRSSPALNKISERCSKISTGSSPNELHIGDSQDDIRDSHVVLTERSSNSMTSERKSGNAKISSDTNASETLVRKNRTHTSRRSSGNEIPVDDRESPKRRSASAKRDDQIRISNSNRRTPDLGSWTESRTPKRASSANRLSLNERIENINPIRNENKATSGSGRITPVRRSNIAADLRASNNNNTYLEKSKNSKFENVRKIEAPRNGRRTTGIESVQREHGRDDEKVIEIKNCVCHDNVTCLDPEFDPVVRVTPRRDKRNQDKPQSRIPLPSYDVIRAEPEMCNKLKRVDSGVDISVHQPLSPESAINSSSFEKHLNS